MRHIILYGLKAANLASRSLNFAFKEKVLERVVPHKRADQTPPVRYDVLKPV
jgi:hypothetical protein